MADPQQQVTAWDASGNPIQSATPPAAPKAWDANGNPISSAPKLDRKQAEDATDALVYSHLTGAPPSYTYQNHDAIKEGLAERLGEYAEAGWHGLTKESIIGEYLHSQVPAPFDNHDEVGNFMEGLGRMLGDLPVYLTGAGLGAIAGGLAGTAELPVVGTVAGSVVGAGAGGFGLTEGMRKWLIDKYSDKKLSSFDEALDVMKAAGKGALTGAAMGFAGEAAPAAEGVVGKLVGSRAYKTAAELAAMTTVGSLVEGRVPTAHDFVSNAAMFAAIHVGTLGVGAAKDYLGKTYVDAGVHPGEVTANPDAVAPPMEEGETKAGALRPAIKIGDKIEPGEPGEHHQDILDRIEPPKTPKPAEGEAAPEEGQPEEEIGEDGEAEHGFVTPQGQYLNRKEAGEWVEQNEPEVSKSLEEAGAGGELTTEDYNEANLEAKQGNRAPSVPAPTAEVSALGKTLNRIREGREASKFGESLRAFFVGNRDARIAETNQLADSLRKQVPDYRDQEALSLMRDFKGNEADLRARRDRYEAGDSEKLKKLVPIIDRALNPTPEMLAADQKLTDYFTKHLDEGKRLGFIDSAVSNEQYITHLLKPETEGNAPKGTGAGAPQIGRSFRFAKERKYDTILDALETGTVKAQSLNALDALNIYGSKHATAAATKLFINQLKDTELGKWGFKRGQNIPQDWVELAPGSGLFRNTVPYIDKETGEPTFAYQSLMVPQKVRDAMAPIIDGGITGIPGFQTLKVFQAYVKAAELGLSVFHMKAMNITALNNQGVTGLVRSMAADAESDAFKEQEQDGIRAGLQTPILGRTVEAYRAVQPSTFPTRMDVIRELPGIKQVDQLSAELTRVTFDVMQRKFKVMDYATKKAAWMAKNPDATAEETVNAKRSIAKEVNAAYGGLNWEVMGASKTFRNVAQAILLAPDWTFSNVVNAKYTFEGGPGGAAARAFWVRSAITGMALTQAMSIAVSGQGSSHPTEAYLGRDKKGKEVYANMFFAGAPKDFITWMNNIADYGAVVGTAATIKNKLSPVPRAGMELMVNKDWMGRDIVKRGTGTMKGTAEGLQHIAVETLPIPFSVSNVAKMLTDTEHDYGFWDYASVVGGSPPRHVPPAGSKPERKKPGKKKFSIR